MPSRDEDQARIVLRTKGLVGVQRTLVPSCSMRREQKDTLYTIRHFFRRLVHMFRARLDFSTFVLESALPQIILFFRFSTGTSFFGFKSHSPNDIIRSCFQVEKMDVYSSLVRRTFPFLRWLHDF